MIDSNCYVNLDEKKGQRESNPKNHNIFMGVNLDDLIIENTKDGIFLKNGCYKQLSKLTGIDVDDAKDIIDNIVINQTNEHLRKENMMKNIIFANINFGHFYEAGAIKEISECFEISLEEAKEEIVKRREYIDYLKNTTKPKEKEYGTSIITSLDDNYDDLKSHQDVIINSKSKINQRKICCPKCHSVNVKLIDNSPGGASVKMDLNPLHPFTPFKVKKKQKKIHSKGKITAAILTGGTSLLVTGGTKKKVDTEWLCMDCGKKFYK